IIGDRPEVRLVYLRGGHDLIAEHLAGREGHFMPPSLLQSQIDTLEEPGPDEDPLTVDVGPPAAQVADEIIRLLGPSAAQGPDPEGTHVRPEQPRGQSRRRRQGALLLSRRGADLQLRPDALQVSAGRISLRPFDTGERAAHPARARVRDPRYRDLRRRPLF